MVRDGVTARRLTAQRLMRRRRGAARAARCARALLLPGGGGPSCDARAAPAASPSAARWSRAGGRLTQRATLSQHACPTRAHGEVPLRACHRAAIDSVLLHAEVFTRLEACVRAQASPAHYDCQ